MNDLRSALEEYLALRRGLGFVLQYMAGALRSFVNLAEKEGTSRITTELALRWAREPPHAKPAAWARKLGMLRRFAIWRSATDPRTEVPPDGLLPYRYERCSPHIYSDVEIDSIVREAAALPSYGGLRGLSCSTLYGLLSVTGMRVSEGLALDRDDVDLEEGVLTVRRTKFGKSRYVPVHDSTRRALAEYAARRDKILPHTATKAFFVGDGGKRLSQDTARHNFAIVSRVIGLRAPALGRRRGRGPRLHDFRHRFAASALIRWYRAGIDVEREIPKLSTYLGHVHVNDTYWYIEAVPELLALASRRVESGRGVKP